MFRAPVEERALALDALELACPKGTTVLRVPLVP
jgi:hypothetical protein